MTTANSVKAFHGCCSILVLLEPLGTQLTRLPASPGSPFSPFCPPEGPCNDSVSESASISVTLFPLNSSSVNSEVLTGDPGYPGSPRGPGGPGSPYRDRT